MSAGGGDDGGVLATLLVIGGLVLLVGGRTIAAALVPPAPLRPDRVAARLAFGHLRAVPTRRRGLAGASGLEPARAAPVRQAVDAR